jgi:cobaltochelatase CobT
MEQVQAEAIGAHATAGMAENFGAMLKDMYRLDHLNDMREQEDAPLNEAVALLVRENLTVAPTFKSLETLVKLWREFIELKVGNSIDGFPPSSTTRSPLRDMLAFMNMAA